MNVIQSDSQSYKLLTHTGDGVYEESWKLDSSQFPRTSGQGWRIEKRRLQGGKQDGVDVIEVNNGELTFTVIPTRGMNILEAEADGIRLGWDSPVNEIVNPGFINVEAKGGTGFLAGFNELVARCGLESTGQPCKDPEGDGTVLSLHDRISNIPASRVWIEIDLNEPCRLTIGGEVRQTRMFGPSFVLTTHITTVANSKKIQIADEVTNISASPQEMELLYHVNLGEPVLGEGAKLLAPVNEISARDKWALEDINRWNVFGKPEAGREEQCYFSTLFGDDAGDTLVGLVSPDEDSAVAMEYSVEQLPFFTLWRNTAAVEEGYVVGMEPGTDYPNPRPFERQKGRLMMLDPGGKHNAVLTMGLKSSDREVRQLKDRIETIRNGRKARVHEDIFPDFSA